MWHSEKGMILETSPHEFWPQEIPLGDIRARSIDNVFCRFDNYSSPRRSLSANRIPVSSQM